MNTMGESVTIQNSDRIMETTAIRKGADGGENLRR